MTALEFHKRWIGNRDYVEWMGDNLPLNEARYLAKRQDELFLGYLKELQSSTTTKF